MTESIGVKKVNGVPGQVIEACYKQDREYLEILVRESLGASQVVNGRWLFISKQLVFLPD